MITKLTQELLSKNPNDEKTAQLFIGGAVFHIIVKN